MADDKKPETEEAADAAPEAEAAAPAEDKATEEKPAEEKPTTVTDLSQLGEAMAAADAPATTAAPVTPVSEPGSPTEPQIDDQGRSYATGKRKDAVARVWIKPGKGQIVVNKRAVETYFARPVLRMVINQPFVAAARDNQFDVFCTVKGGGLSGQAGAVRHGISQALALFEPSLRATLKRAAS